MSNKYQVVIIETRDGKKAYFTGRAVFDASSDLRIKSIEVTEAKGLPPDCSFGVMPKTDESLETGFREMGEVAGQYFDRHKDIVDLVNELRGQPIEPKEGE